MRSDIEDKLSHNMAGAIFVGFFAVLLVVGQWYAAWHFDPPFRMGGGKDVHGLPHGYAVIVVVLVVAAVVWQRRWRNWLTLPDEPGSRAVGFIMTVALAMWALAFAVLAFKALLLFDYNEWLEGGSGYDWRPISAERSSSIAAS